jgi:erythronate-4-phosphate dehydrogenase
LHVVKILADQNIPCVAEAFRDLGEVTLMPGREIRREHLTDCQCLVIRTVTRVDAALLDDTPVEFVGTATIGTDHVDLDYLAKSNIGCSNAAGCNAEAASEYVISGLFALAKRKGLDPFQMKAGIVGFGNVGSRLYQKLGTLGLECLVCDPPLQESGITRRDFVDLDTILKECNFISLHVPLTNAGKHPTFHLLDSEQLQHLATGCLLVNAARGEVVNNQALLDVLRRREDLLVFLDTWENEPNLLRELLQRVDLATPHIAGYSVEGRLRGTQMALDAACAHFGIPSGWHMSQQLPPDQDLILQPSDSTALAWHDLFYQHFDIWRDHEALTAGSHLDDATFARHFDALRRVYPDRLEYERFIVQQQDSGAPAEVIQQLGFQIGG